MSNKKLELLERYLEFTPNMSNADFAGWLEDVTYLFSEWQAELQILSENNNSKPHQ